MTILIAVVLIPHTLVMFAINAGILYFAWSAGWATGLALTSFLVGFLALLAVLTARRMKKRKAGRSS